MEAETSIMVGKSVGALIAGLAMLKPSVGVAVALILGLGL